MLKLAITGVAGRMGRAVVQATAENPAVQLSAAVHRPGSSFLGVDAGQLAGVGTLNVPITRGLENADFDCLVDFTLVDSALENLRFCRANNKAIVIGTTGFDEPQRLEIKAVGADIRVVLAPNMSVGVNLCFALLEQAAAVLGDEADIEIMETHHRHKLDSPSGTAIRMGEVIATTLGRDLKQCAIYGREGLSEPRDRNTIGFATTRAGDVVGEHTVLFASEGERVEITHKASSRQTFAKGALRAALWLQDQPSGFYDMQDVLGLRR
ncbi:MAG: 4-hydroxy-tetrahydrodipicolinate reductase [Polaribacter sp.]|jgi:4-hydroxy-tetrahydrodipicolinate reductase